jgi:23S rRNA pseudouridine1911/1915/1917 synthase
LAKKQEITVIEVSSDSIGQRLDLFLVSHFSELSRNQLQQMIKAQKVCVNHRPGKSNQLLKDGDVLQVLPDDLGKLESFLRPEAIPLNIVFEDEELIVVDKPPGLTVHPGAGVNGPTLIEGILHHTGGFSGEGHPTRPGVVHRLDKDTSGLMVVAKTESACLHLANQFRIKTSERYYVSLLHGILPSGLTEIESYLGRDPNRRLRFMSHAIEDVDSLAPTFHPLRYAKSTFELRRHYGKAFSLVAVKLDTGRTHQIRVHAKALGCPVVGDKVYGDRKPLPHTIPAAIKSAVQSVARQMLHSKILLIDHPKADQRMRFEVDLPADFAELIVKMKENTRD